jgi:hypothetical protein
MKIPPDAVIAPEKLTQYLLVPKEVDDKSKFLAQAGFTLEEPELLEAAIRQLIEQEEAESDRVDEYGTYYLVKGNVAGTEERQLAVVTVWIEDVKLKQFRFVTLKPWRKDDDET